MRLFAILLLAASLFLPAYPAFARQEKFTENKIKDIATVAAKGKGFSVKEAVITYDKEGQLWLNRIGYLAGEDTSPNHSILRKGFLKNYYIVYFDYSEPAPDVWVFIDKDTGDVLEVYQEQASSEGPVVSEVLVEETHSPEIPQEP